MDTLILENVRCFGERQEIPLAPLTVLVGENSTGKSTFMAALRIAWDLGAGRSAIDFNQDPLRLGAYEQLASYRGGRAGRAKSFTIGQETSPRRIRTRTAARLRVEGCFTAAGSQPYLSCRSLTSGPYGFAIEPEKTGAYLFSVTTPAGTQKFTPEDRELPSWLGRGFPWIELPYFLAVRSAGRTEGSGAARLAKDDMQALEEIAAYARYETSRPHAFAPVRSRPERTYDPVTDIPDPEGRHIPMVLARLLADRKGVGAELRQTLAQFGEDSGLCSAIDIHRLGKESDPFQIFVKIAGPKRNLIDIGYGVSQILPILVEILTSERGATFLIQQPEVHLHPRAQAALATLFARLVKERGCRLVVETHSDYFIDRLKVDLRNRNIASPSEIALLYFEPTAAGTQIHRIALDPLGNIVAAPPSYRRFFLEEERRYFGGA